MTAPKVAIRLGTEGKEDVKRDAREVGEAWEASANRAVRAYDKAATDFESADRRRAAAAQKIAAIMPQTAVQMRINDAVGTGSSLQEGSARASAAAFRELFAEQERLTAGAAALRAQIDPTWVAQQRFNNEIAQARTLVAAGAITLDEYCGKLRIEQGLLNEVSGHHGRVITSTGAMRAGAQQMSYQLNDMVTMWSMQAPVMQIFTSQAGQVIQSIQLMAGESKGFIGWLGGPWGMALTTAGIVLATLAGHYLSNDEAAKKAESSAKAFGDRQSDIANFIDTTTGALKEQNRTLVLNAILTRQAQVAANEKAITESRNKVFSIAGNARRDVAGNPQSWDPDVANVQRVLDTDVQSALRASGGDIDKLSTSIANLARTSRPDLKGLALEITGIGGQAVVAARENKDLAKELRALNGDTAALLKTDTSMIEARAKLAGATSAADRAQAQYTITVREMRAAYEASNKDASAQKVLLEGLASAERSLNSARDSGKASRAGAVAARKEEREAEREREAALRKILALEKERFGWLNSQNVGGGSRDALNAQGEKLADRQKFFKTANDDISAGTVLLNLEWEMRGKSRREIEAAVEVRRYQLDLEREGRDLTAEQVDVLVKAKAAQIAFTNALDDSNGRLMAMRDIGSNVVDTVLNPSNWSSWKNVAMSAINDVVSAMWKLAVINPIQNQISGGNLPTIGSLFGLLGGGRAKNGGSAIGNMYTPAGAMLVGENGPEIVNMPRGAQVMTASDTRRAMASNDNGLQIRVIKGDLFDVEISRISTGVSAQVVSAAAPIIASGASNGAQQAVSRRNSRRLA
ncbi:hypothetical protein KRZ98_10025 [Sphingobium sp. AS12]|uniref:hypothetical protein n=1 Tax=Sphingobium sp. AS12 TaxID=2849495 RepID=UPI001C31C7CC|nr:hypothetical protein [Sphingobium sp. AS12]MBV2148622.1 hypothetical protein [Sphingobium sp. AS12]